MVCNLEYINPYFTIENVLRKERIRYAFTGVINDYEKNIFGQLEKKETISKEDIKYLEQKYGLSYTNWINLNSHTKIHFIDEQIYMTDTLHNIKNKICAFVHGNNIILPENQQIWFVTNAKKYRVIGTIFEHHKNIPIIVQYKEKKWMKDKDKFITIKNGQITRIKHKIINENNFVISDLIDNIQPNHLLYVSDMMSEVMYLTSIKVKIKKDLIYSYLNRFWIKGKIIENRKNSEKVYDNIYKLVMYNNNVSKLLDKVDINNNNFSDCNIIQCFIHINWNDDLELDLLKIYNKLRANLSHRMPFLKYRDNEWDIPYSSIYSEEEHIISAIPADLLKQWIYTEYRKTRNNHTIKMISDVIIIKRVLYDKDDIKKYFTITLYKTGRINVIISASNDIKGNFELLSHSITEIGETIKLINQVITPKLHMPYIKILPNNIELSSNITITRMVVQVDYKQFGKLDLDEMYNLSKVFNHYIIKKNDSKKINSFNIKYIRVSNFENMSEIFEMISLLFNEKHSEYDILFKIEKVFNIDHQKSINYLKEWKKKIGIFATKKNMTKQSGINISIENNIKINGGTDFKELYNAYHFIIRFMTIYMNIKTYMKNKNFKSILNKSEQYIYNNKSINITNINENENIINNLQLINNIFNDSYTNSISNNINNIASANKFLNDQVNGNKIPQHNASKLADNYQIEQTLLMTCDDPIEELDVCTDICDDPNYILRRLQRYDNKLFKFAGKNKSGKKIDNYSRKCGKSNSRQPIVLNYDPDLDKSINRNSYTYAIKFRSSPDIPYRWYICPRVWDPYAQKPVAYEQVKKIQDKRMKTGKICRIGVGPYNNKVIINSTSNFNRDDTPYPSGYYPGFLKPASHPDGLCMPCCFEAPQKIKATFKKCMGQNINENKVNFTENYILGVEKIPLDVGRYGILSVNIGTLLGECKKEHGYLYENEKSYLRKGIVQNRYKSFIYCMVQIFSNMLGAKFEESMVSSLMDVIKNNLNNNKTLFNSLANGLIKRIFKNKDSNKSSFENFINYLNSDTEIIKIELIWDLFQRPGIIDSKGINIIIFDKNNILCPPDPSNFYDIHKKTVFILKYYDYYEPIYYVKYNNNIISSSCVFDYNHVIKKILSIINTQCLEYYNLDWKRVLKNQNMYDSSIDQLKKQYTIQYSSEQLSSLNNTYHIKKQIMDHYFKVYMIQLNNDLILPVKPTSSILKYSLVDFNDIDFNNLPTYSDTKKELSYITSHTKMKYTIEYKILEKKKKYIVAIILNTGAVIPIKQSNIVQDSIPSKDITFFNSIDRYIKNDVELPNKRSEIINKIKFENETYERLRLMVAQYLNKYSKIKDQIIQLINTKDKLKIKREKMSTLIYSFVKKMTYIDSKPIKLDNYSIPNIRTICYKDKNCTNIHCANDSKKCKLRVMKDNLITKKNNITVYINNISEELIRNPFKGNNILYNQVPVDLDSQIIRPYPHEILLDTREKFTNIDTYYKTGNKYHTNIYDNIDYLTTSQINLNKYKYLLIENNIKQDFQDYELSSHWKKVLGTEYDTFKYRIYKDVDFKKMIEIAYNKNIDITSNNIDTLAKYLSMNVLILESRITKYNKKGFILHRTSNNKSIINKFIILYSYKKNTTKFYTPIIINKNIGPFETLPSVLHGYINDVSRIRIKIKK
jgi:hypothetical protein